MVANQTKYATYTAEIRPTVVAAGVGGAGGGDGGESSTTTGESTSGQVLGLGLPAVVLGAGVLVFDQEAAALVPPEQNLRLVVMINDIYGHSLSF